MNNEINNILPDREVVGINDWNVINNEDFKKIIDVVFNSVASCLGNTLGPYGTTTIVEQFGEMHITKDGWNVLKKIHFKNMTHQNVLQLLYNIAAQVVTKVGDGSTSSIMAANELFNTLNNSNVLKVYRPKEFIDVLNRMVYKICDIITKNAQQIKPENGFDEIRKLAMVSTNGDVEIANMIHRIYKETENPSIEYSKAKGRDTTLEIIEGYKANISYLDAIYAQNEEGICKVKNPIFLLFDHKIEKDIHFDNVIKPTIEYAIKYNRRLIVVAPHYDAYLLNYLKSTLGMEFKSTGTSTVVYTRVSLINNLLHLLYSDFAVMCNATVMSEGVVSDICASENENRRKMINNIIGTCGVAEIGPKTTLISDFTDRNEDMYQKHMNQAMGKYKEELINQGDMAIVSMTLYELNQRISKLRGKMGHISIGGYTSLEKTARKDLVEDAVKACESAYNNGYNLGGNLAIIIAIDEISREYSLDEAETLVLGYIRDAFTGVFKKVLKNKTTDTAYIDNALEQSLAQNKTFNIITDECDDSIINSCNTDIEILKATSSIISLLISSNQYLSIVMDR